jgi:phage antirepressor YoqD-like protein
MVIHPALPRTSARVNKQIIFSVGAASGTFCQFWQEDEKDTNKVCTPGGMQEMTIRVTKTTKVTGKGQVYFVNLFLNRGRNCASKTREKVG